MENVVYCFQKYNNKKSVSSGPETDSLDKEQYIVPVFQECSVSPGMEKLSIMIWLILI